MPTRRSTATSSNGFGVPITIRSDFNSRTRSGRSARRCSLGALRLSTTAAVVCARSCSCASLRVSAKQSCELASCRFAGIVASERVGSREGCGTDFRNIERALDRIEDPHDRATISREAKRIAERLVDLNWEALQLLAERLNKAGKLDLADVLDFLRGRPLRSRRAGLARRKAAGIKRPGFRPEPRPRALLRPLRRGRMERSACIPRRLVEGSMPARLEAVLQ